MEGTSLKQFKVAYASRKKKHLILYDTHQRFVEKCKEKFDIPKAAVVFFVSEDDEDVEIDSDILAHCYADKSLLIMKVEADDINSPISDAVTNDAKSNASNVGDAVTNGAKSNASNVGSDEGDGTLRSESDEGDDTIRSGSDEQDDTLKSDTGAFCKDEKYEIEEWEKIEEGSEMRDHISKFGLQNIGNLLKKSLDKWREKPLHIAVTGASGKGKSSFINALRGLSPDDRSGANVDIKECTKIPTPYRYPEIDNIIIWDVPGVGTIQFPQDTYLEKINFDKYDAFIVVTTERFTEIDSWLMSEVKRRQKRRYILRTKIDIDMDNIKRKCKNQGSFSEKDAFIKLKKGLVDEMVKSMKGDSDFYFFMISNYHTNKYDFSNLQFQLYKDLPSEKKTAMLFGMASISEKIVEEKAKLLDHRIWKIALLSATGAAIPFVSVAIDVSVILREVKFYRNQFALDDNSLTKLAEMSDVTLDELKTKVDIKTHGSLFSTGGIYLYLANYAAANPDGKVVQYNIPMIGTMISCGMSFKSTQAVLTEILEMMKEDAIKILKFVAEKNGGVA